MICCKKCGTGFDERVLLTEAEASEFLNVKISFLRNQRWSGKGIAIPYVKIGGKHVRYKIGDLERYVEEQLRVNTTQEVGNGK